MRPPGINPVAVGVSYAILARRGSDYAAASENVVYVLLFMRFVTTVPIVVAADDGCGMVGPSADGSGMIPPTGPGELRLRMRLEDLAIDLIIAIAAALAWLQGLEPPT